MTNNWVSAMAYGITVNDFEFGTFENVNSNKNMIIRLEPTSAPFNEDLDFAEKFTSETHFVDVIIMVRGDPIAGTHNIPTKLIDLIRYVKKLLKQAKTKVTDIENIQMIGEAPIDRDPRSEWWGWSITVGLQLFIVTTVN